MFTNDVSEEISTQPSNQHVKFSSITVVHHLQINPNSNWVFFLFYVSSSSRKDRKSAPLRILSSLCVFNRNRHWDESKRRWIGMKKEKKYFGNWKNIHRLPIRKESFFFLKKGDTIKCDIQERKSLSIMYRGRKSSNAWEMNLIEN